MAVLTKVRIAILLFARASANPTPAAPRLSFPLGPTLG